MEEAKISSKGQLVIPKYLRDAVDMKEGDTVIITGKGSETSMAVSGNKKIPWSDKNIVIDYINFK